MSTHPFTITQVQKYTESQQNSASMGTHHLLQHSSMYTYNTIKMVTKIYLKVYSNTNPYNYSCVNNFNNIILRVSSSSSTAP